MIYPYSHENLSRWVKGELQCQIDIPGRRLPMGWCDGSDEDELELRSMAEEEDVEDLPIQKKLLKTGRQVWTVGAEPVQEEGADDD